MSSLAQQFNLQKPSTFRHLPCLAARSAVLAPLDHQRREALRLHRDRQPRLSFFVGLSLCTYRCYTSALLVDACALVKHADFPLIHGLPNLTYTHSPASMSAASFGSTWVPPPRWITPVASRISTPRGGRGRPFLSRRVTSVRKGPGRLQRGYYVARLYSNYCWHRARLALHRFHPPLATVRRTPFL